MMKLIRLLLKKDGVGKRGSREVAKNNTYMKTGKAAGPSGIVAEMLNASGDTGARLVADLANDMVRNGVIPSDWEDSFIINIYKGKGDALEVTTEVSNSLIMP